MADNRVVVQKYENNKFHYSIIDFDGNVIFDAKALNCNTEKDGIIEWRKKDNYKSIVFTDYNGTEIATFDTDGINFPRYSGEIITYKDKESGKFGAIDLVGNIVVDFIYDSLGIPSDGMISFSEYGLYGYVDYSGSRIIEPKYDLCRPFKGRFAYVEKNGQGMFIDKDNNILFEFDHYLSTKSPDPMDYFSDMDGLLYVHIANVGKGFFYDLMGNELFTTTGANPYIYKDNVYVYGGRVYTIKVE